MFSSLDDGSGLQPYHILLTREQHRRLRLVCTTLRVPMSEFIRCLVRRGVDRRFVKLGLDRVPIVPGPGGKKPDGKRARPRKAS
jgi:hypothetical protein